MRLRKLYILVATVSVICITTLIYSVEHYNLAGFSDEPSKLTTQKLENEETGRTKHGHPDSITEITEFIGGEWKVTYRRDRPEAVEQLEVRKGEETDYNPRLIKNLEDTNIQEKVTRGKVSKDQPLTSFGQRSKKRWEQLEHEDSDGGLQPIDDPETALVNDPGVVLKMGKAGLLRQQLAQSRGSLGAFQFRNMSSQASSLKTLQKLREQFAAQQHSRTGVTKPGELTHNTHVLNQRVEQSEKAAGIRVPENVEERSPDGVKQNPPESKPRDQQDVREMDDEYDVRNDEAENRPVELVQLKRTAVGRNPSSIVQHQSNDREPKTAPELQPSSNHNNFSVNLYLSMPLPQFTQPTILKSEWVQLLKEYLGTLKSKQLSIVTATQEHEVVLLNWLISALVVADPPLENILVLSLSESLANLLQSKGIPVILVEPSTVIRDTARNLIRTAFSEVHIVRLSFFRLINHWGFDVVMYDGDAIILKNPQPLFDSYPGVELIGSAGKGPDKVFNYWGRTICTGVLLMRASNEMGELLTRLRDGL